MRREITFTLNGEEKSVFVEPNITLLQVLREQLTVTSPKRSCEQGECGACTIILNGKAVNACLVLAVTVQGKRVETVESLANGTELHPLQRAFVDITDRKNAEERLLQNTVELRRSNEELERFNRAMVGRELRMVELKKQVNELCSKLGEPRKYKTQFEEGNKEPLG